MMPVGACGSARTLHAPPESVPRTELQDRPVGDAQTEELVARLAERRSQTKSKVIREALVLLAQSEADEPERSRPYQAHAPHRRRPRRASRLIGQDRAEIATSSEPRQGPPMVVGDTGPLVALIHTDDAKAGGSARGRVAQAREAIPSASSPVRSTPVPIALCFQVVAARPA